MKSHGFRVEAHAIGDRAATWLVDAFEKFMPSAERPVLTHCQQLGAMGWDPHGCKIVVDDKIN